MHAKYPVSQKFSPEAITRGELLLSLISYHAGTILILHAIICILLNVTVNALSFKDIGWFTDAKQHHTTTGAKHYHRTTGAKHDHPTTGAKARPLTHS